MKMTRMAKTATLMMTMATASAMAMAPIEVNKVKDGWEFEFMLPSPVEFNFVTIREKGDNATSWQLLADGWRYGCGGAIGAECRANLMKVGKHQLITLAVQGEKQPDIEDLTVSLVPLADGIDPKLMQVKQIDEKTVFFDFGRDTALLGFSYDGDLGDFSTDYDLFINYDFELEKRDMGALNGNFLVRRGKEHRLHNSVRTCYLKIRSKRAPIDGAKFKFLDVPYRWTQHLTDETWEEKLKRMEWWTRARFGMFIHFGLYALPARHEWYKTNQQVSEEKYDEYFRNFNPDKFDAREWARMAKAAGMKYAVLTTKHHEGFCLWDTKATDYKITNTPFGRDLVREYVDAFRAEGLRVGFYYSLIDWHHPDYTIDCAHPRRPGGLFNGSKDCSSLNTARDMEKYRAYMKQQVTELLTNYGKIDIIWYDFSFPRIANGKDRDDWDSKGLLALTRKLQPGIIVDNRLDLPDYEDGWDFATPEQIRVTGWFTVDGRKVPWETCQTFSGSWGYYRDEKEWKSDFQILEQLILTVSKGGNVIMNVGPTGRGEFDYRARERLQAYGKWLQACGESIYGCTAAPEKFAAPANTVLTYNPETKRLYMHILAYSWGGIQIPFYRYVKYAQFLNDKSEVTLIGDLLQLPVVKPPVEIPVVEFQL